MDLRKQFDETLKALVSERLGAAGYRKDGRNLVRDCGDYVERLNFQADRYNVPATRCRYFLNAGLVIPGLSSAVLDLHKRNRFYYSHRGRNLVAIDFHADVAWASRAEEIVPSAPAEWVLTPGFNRDLLKDQLADLVPLISAELAHAYRFYRWAKYPLMAFDRILRLFKGGGR